MDVIKNVKGDIVKTITRYNDHLHLVLKRMEVSFYELSRKLL